MFTLEQITHFWTHVAIKGDDECWDWLGHINRNGDGIVELGGRPYRPYSVAWHLTGGSLGCRIVHICENPSCCNPSHLRREEIQWEPPPGVTV